MNNRGSNKNETKSKTYRTSPPRQTKSEKFVFD